MALTPEQRSMRARAAAYAMHAKHGGLPLAKARAAQQAKWAAEVDPEGRLDPDELERRVKQRQRQHMASMSLRASQARARKSRASALATGGEAAPSTTAA